MSIKKLANIVEETRLTRCFHETHLSLFGKKNIIFTLTFKMENHKQGIIASTPKMQGRFYQPLTGS